MKTQLRSWVFFGGCAAVLGAGIACYWLAIEQITRDEPNYSLIEEGLYLGALVPNPPPGTQAVLNLCERSDPYQCAVHRWEPIHDGSPAPDLEWLRRMVAFIDEQRAAGRTTYVHCHAGVSRAGMVVIAYVMQKHGLTRDQALAHVRARRPTVRPNPAFMDRLLEWEKALAVPLKASESPDPA